MIDSVEIDKALEAHGAWKDRLMEAVYSGKVDVPVANIRTDNQCAFGKWLYGTTLTDEDRATEHYSNVVRLHAEFHKVAAQIAGLATVGKRSEAQRMLEFGNEYTKVSGQLSLALKRWKESVRKVVAG
jgi:hypothetical protein